MHSVGEYRRIWGFYLWPQWTSQVRTSDRHVHGDSLWISTKHEHLSMALLLFIILSFRIFAQWCIVYYDIILKITWLSVKADINLFNYHYWTNNISKQSSYLYSLYCFVNFNYAWPYMAKRVLFDFDWWCQRRHRPNTGPHRLIIGNHEKSVLLCMKRD